MMLCSITSNIPRIDPITAVYTTVRVNKIHLLASSSRCTKFSNETRCEGYKYSSEKMRKKNLCQVSIFSHGVIEISFSKLWQFLFLWKKKKNHDVCICWYSWLLTASRLQFTKLLFTVIGGCQQTPHIFPSTIKLVHSFQILSDSAFPVFANIFMSGQVFMKLQSSHTPRTFAAAVFVQTAVVTQKFLFKAANQHRHAQVLSTIPPQNYSHSYYKKTSDSFPAINSWRFGQIHIKPPHIADCSHAWMLHKVYKTDAIIFSWRRLRRLTSCRRMKTGWTGRLRKVSATGWTENYSDPACCGDC